MIATYLDLARRFVCGETIDVPIKKLSYLLSKEGKTLLNRFVLPVANSYIETLIRITVRLPVTQRLEHAHLKVAVVSALLFPLRQIVGSCFATAPAIYIQNERPQRLLLDLYDLMMMGKMKRVVEGKEYIVPISPKWGEREEDHPLLRAWEYTIASFSDYKTTFSSWNLYSSLGLNPQHKGGIGEFIYATFQARLDTFQQEVETLYATYSRAIDEARVFQALLRQADSIDQIRMRKAEFEVRAQHAGACKGTLDKGYENAREMSQFFSFVIQQYSEKFQEYFLEIFDPNVESITSASSCYEDRPAGFCLVYKHGRSDPLAWTLIEDEKGFFEALRFFFLAVEKQICFECQWEEGRKELEALTTKLVHFIDSQSFHQFALKNKRPWSYTSGGSLHTLIKGYFMIAGSIKEEKRPIESPMDLLIFLLELLKSLPYRITKSFEQDSTASLLMYSPTHAFLLKPGLSPFREGWLDKGFTYTWIRDHVIDPATNHYRSIRLDGHTQRRLISKICEDQFCLDEDPCTLQCFRSAFLRMAPQKENEIDDLLYQSFSIHPPLFFGDTNWLDYAFAFAINPATMELDLYRISADGQRSYPMNAWRPYLDGTIKKDWGVLTCPSDYLNNPLSEIALTLKKV